MQVQIDRCFGFDTAVEEAQRSLISARVEARSSGGISVVKLMGRQSGFIAMNASMASGGCCRGGGWVMLQWWGAAGVECRWLVLQWFNEPPPCD